MNDWLVIHFILWSATLWKTIRMYYSYFKSMWTGWKIWITAQNSVFCIIASISPIELKERRRYLYWKVFVVLEVAEVQWRTAVAAVGVEEGVGNRGRNFFGSPPATGSCCCFRRSRQSRTADTGSPVSRSTSELCSSGTLPPGQVVSTRAALKAEFKEII